MHRRALHTLTDWGRNPLRKPLVIRGARQVGKTWLVREFARRESLDLVELNLERRPELGDLFTENDPARWLNLLEGETSRPVLPGGSLLFLDEIQAHPPMFSKLRWFYEDLPDLHVVAAGSLLDLELAHYAHSVPVGRIQYLHLGPMDLEEVLAARGDDRLLETLREYLPGEDLPPARHRQLMRRQREYLWTGGMPEAVSLHLETDSPAKVAEAQHTILQTFREDFSKYGTRLDPAVLRRVFHKIPELVGQKFRYVNVDRDRSARSLSRALDLLCRARVTTRVPHSSANGIPLGAEVKEGHFKVLFLDVGLMSASLGLNLASFDGQADPLLVHEGSLAEQFVGQTLLHSLPAYVDPSLHYWVREKRGASAEVDYVLQVGTDIVPVEVKAGRAGRLRSLRVFLERKGFGLGTRLNADLPSLLDADTALGKGRLGYQLLSLPLYMAGQVRRLVEHLVASETP